MPSACETDISGMPDEAINIYAAIKYLSKEAKNDGLKAVRIILERTAGDIINVYCGNKPAIKGTEEMVDSLFLSFLLLTKYLTAGSEKAKREFLEAISVIEEASLAKTGYKYA